MKKNILSFYPKTILTIVLLFLISSKSLSQNKVVVLPESISEGDEVEMALAAFYQYCINTHENIEGDRYHYEVDGSNHITVTVVGLVYSPCPGGGSVTDLTHFYSLGQLEKGNYTAQMQLVDASVTFPPQPSQQGLLVGDNLSFAVNGVPATIPTLSFLSALALISIVLLIAFKKISSKLIISIVLLMVFSSGSSSKTFHILLSGTEGAPAPQKKQLDTICKSKLAQRLTRKCD